MKSTPLLEIQPSLKDISGMPIHRVLPNAKKRMVGPFIFLDHMGPHEFDIGHRMEVRAHPHIGLSTLTYLFEGRIQHHDSLGNFQVITPGEVNWMTAGKGISHTERGVEGDQLQKQKLHGLQFWVALPDQLEEMKPEFQNYKESQIPRLRLNGLTVDVIAGTFRDVTSEVKTFSKALLLNFKSDSSGSIQLNEGEQEICLYLISGALKINSKNYESGCAVIFSENSEIDIQFSQGAHFVAIGGHAFKTPRNIFWNFVSSSKEKIEKAKIDWNQGDFPMVPGENERLLSPV